MSWRRLLEVMERKQTQPPTMYIAVAFYLPRQSSNECSFNLSTERGYGKSTHAKLACHLEG
jgi:hypothetical protein